VRLAAQTLALPARRVKNGFLAVLPYLAWQRRLIAVKIVILKSVEMQSASEEFS